MHHLNLQEPLDLFSTGLIVNNFEIVERLALVEISCSEHSWLLFFVFNLNRYFVERKLILKKLHLVVKTSLVAILLFIMSACSTKYENRQIISELFPSVSGKNLEGVVSNIPKDFSGRKVLFLLGYVQNAQFDIDRWLIGLDMTNTEVEVYELPTIQGMFPRFFETQINQGMRNGIPKSLWKGVITIFDDGETIQEFTGNINPNNARVILLNEKTEILFFDDSGFSVESLNNLRTQINRTISDETG